MQTRVTEIADHIYRLSTFVPDVGPTGFTFNQFLIDDEQPLLFHTGPRGMFPLVVRGDRLDHAGRAAAVDHVRPRRVRRVRRDERVPRRRARRRRSRTASWAAWCRSTTSPIGRPLPMADGQVLELGTHRVRHIDTPHVPHGWEARVLYDETTGTLFAGDLFTNLGDPAPVTSDDIVGVAAEAEDMFGATCLTPDTAPTIRRLAELAPTTIAVMHGASFSGDGRAALNALADDYEKRFTSAL